MLVPVGTKQLECSAMHHSINSRTYRQEFNENGYLYVKDLLPRRIVQRGRDEIVDYLNSNNAPLMDNQEWIRKSISVIKVLEHQKLKSVTESVLNCSTITMPFKWLRAVETGLNTGLHSDAHYLGHISDNMVTVWIPMMDIPIGMGGMVVAPKSHYNELWRDVQLEYKAREKGNGTTSGWISNDPSCINRQLRRVKRELGLREDIEWVSSDFKMGDVVVLDMNTMHITGTNTTAGPRISCDTRWIAVPTKK